MYVKTHKTHPITQKDSLFQLIDAYLPPLKEGSIFIITSKVISICEGSVLAKNPSMPKESLIQQSADAYLDLPAPHAVQLTIKNHMLIPSAGIDESNGNGMYILHPQNSQQSATAIWDYIRKRDKIREVGVLITDSHLIPMRRGTIGVALGWCGFKALYTYIGKTDCFGLPFTVTMVNILDALAATAVFCMGEGNEQTPFATLTDVPKVEFQTVPPTEEEVRGLSIPIEEDVYAPLLKNPHWVINSNELQFVKKTNEDSA